MSGKIVILSLPGETIAGRFDDDRLESLFVQRDDQPILAGSLFLGRVTDLDKKNNWAFVDLKLPQGGFLPLSEAPKGLSVGQHLALVVTREAVEGKGARVSANLSDEQARHLPPSLPQAAGLLWQAENLAAWLKRQPQGLPRHEAFNDPLAPELEGAIDGLLRPGVPFGGKGHLLVEPVRALTAIDVNSGPGETAAANRAAVPEIIRQIELRNLGGRIVVDFIAMGGPRRRLELEKDLKAAAGQSRATKIGQVLPSGLCEITRQRRGLSLHELLCVQVGEGGCGWSPSPQTLIYRALRGVLRLPSPTRVTLTARRPILDALDRADAARHFVEERLGLKLETRAQDDPDLYDWDLSTQ